jgi:hypothetical protein
MKYWIAFLLPFVCFADKVPHLLPAKGDYVPWLTGPLITPSARIVPVGYYYVEPYVYLIGNTGTYNGHWNSVKNDHTFWANSFQPTIQIGLTQWMDFDIYPTVYYNYTDHEAKWAFGDLPIAFDFQLYISDHEDWLPDVVFTIKELFPTGKYDRLDPKKKGTDVGGNGSFNTGVELVFGKLFHLGGVHFTTQRLAFSYNLPAPVHLKGFNVYGGGYGTDARFFPAQTFQIAYGTEISLSQNWVLACDLVGVWATKTHFSGNSGTTATGAPATLGTGSSAQFSLAPAFEYNWSQNIGIIAGSWFTFAGRKSVQFSSFIAAFSWYI